MKTTHLWLVVLCALPIYGEEAQPHRNFLAEVYPWGDSLPEAPAGTVQLPAFKVKSTQVDTPSQTTRDLEKLFNGDLDSQNAEVRREASVFGPIAIRTERPILFGQIENMFNPIAPQRDLAVKLQDGFRPSSNFTVRIRNSSLVWKFGWNDLWSIALKPSHGGVKLTVRRDL